MSGTASPRCTRISKGDTASSGTVSGVTPGLGAISISLSVERAVDHIHLLLAGQPHEVYRVTGYADRQARILLRMIHRIQQCIAVQDVDVHVIAGRPEEAVENGRQVRDPVILVAAEPGRNERRRQGNTV